MSFISDYAARLSQAMREFVDLRDRVSNPNGTFDKAGRFYLAEKYKCCEGLRSPTRAYPYSQMVHGRTALHAAYTYNVDVTHVRKLSSNSATAEQLAIDALKNGPILIQKIAQGASL